MDFSRRGAALGVHTALEGSVRARNFALISQRCRNGVVSLTIELHMVWDGATEDEANVNYLAGANEDFMVFREVVANPVEKELQLLQEIFPQGCWTSDRNNPPWQEYDFESAKPGSWRLSGLGWLYDNRLMRFTRLLWQFFKLGKKKQSQGLNPKVWLFSDEQGFKESSGTAPTIGSRCPRCGGPTETGWTFCQRCGARLT